MRGTAQMTNVSMPIFSVRKLAKTHLGVFDKDDGYFEHKVTGQKTRFFGMNGVYYMRIKTLPPDPKTVSEPRKPFGRPE